MMDGGDEDSRSYLLVLFCSFAFIKILAMVTTAPPCDCERDGIGAEEREVVADDEVNTP